MTSSHLNTSSSHAPLDGGTRLLMLGTLRALALYLIGPSVCLREKFAIGRHVDSGRESGADANGHALGLIQRADDRPRLSEEIHVAGCAQEAIHLVHGIRPRCRGKRLGGKMERVGRRIVRDGGHDVERGE